MQQSAYSNNPAVVSLLFFAAPTAADLRLGSTPRKKYDVLNYGGSIPFVTQKATYMEPSTFGYQGLNAQNGQKRNNYDNFLRSNIDNEQDQRNFVTNVGLDHLPFRTREGSVPLSFQVGRYDNVQPFGRVNLTMSVEVGERNLLPLRWNNPHASELEVNVWLMRTDPLVVVPIRLPTCSGEGYQDNIVEFTVPEDFLDLGAKVPGFTGCGVEGDCVLQVYAHSVESRTYALGVPLMVHGHKSELVTSVPLIEPARQDPWFDIAHLRNTCLFNTASTANIPTAVPRYARLVSDVFNHAYQDSDFSPYQGQQFESISKNLQAACLLKGVSGNRGELGKTLLTDRAKNARNELNNAANNLYKRYEGMANNIINQLGNAMKSTGNIGEQKVNTCFHCAEVGSTNTNRLQTTTYIPSFKLAPNLIARARAMVPAAYQSLITDDGEVQIYVATLRDLLPKFKSAAENYGLTYQPAKVKDTLATLADATHFRKISHITGQQDQGQYAAEVAKKAHYTTKNCPAKCFECGSSQVRYPLFRTSSGTCDKFCSANDQCSDAGAGTDCRGCAGLYTNGKMDVKATPISEAMGNEDSLPATGSSNVRDMTDAEMHGTGTAATDGDIDQSTNGNPDGATPADPNEVNPVAINPDNSRDGLGSGGTTYPGYSGGVPGSSTGASMGEAGAIIIASMAVSFAGGLVALGCMFYAKTGPFKSWTSTKTHLQTRTNDLKEMEAGNLTA